MNAWLKELATKGKNLMGTVDKRKTAAIGAIAKQSGVSENTVARVIEAMQEVDTVCVALLLGFKESDVQAESVGDAAFEDATPPADEVTAKVTRDKSAEADPDQQDDKPNGI